jgi:drug/metabolite transporter (DMT)-like permease
MLIWFLLALGAAIGNSFVQVTQKWAVSLTRYSKLTIVLIASATASILLFLISFFIAGIPEIDARFWLAALITGSLNGIALPLLLKAYEVGEFSAVYCMILLTPVFLFFTSFIFLGERPSLIGAAGVLIALLGLWIITRANHQRVVASNFALGNWLGAAVALIWSVTVNFDKLAARYSDIFFAPAVSMAIISATAILYLLIRHRSVLVENRTSDTTGKDIMNSGIVAMLLLGLAMVFSNVFHNAALLQGLATYTIAVKRVGVLFGVLWGWLFFKEKNIAKKALGAAIAVVGVVAILFS